MTDADTPTYTLAEGERELRRRECLYHGHDWEVLEAFGGDVQGILCGRCGWSGQVTMGERS